MEENPSLQFIRDLYSKYNIQLDPEKEQKVLSHFNRDFDQSLSVFYEKYNPEKLPDLTPEKISTWKNAYGISMPEAPVSYPIVQSEAPDGFFANLKNGLSNLDENVANSFWYTLNAADRGISAAFNTAFGAVEKDGVKDYSSANSEFFLNKIAENKDALAPTKGIIDSVEQGDIGGAAAGVLNTSVDFLRSIVSGVASAGTIPILEQAESMYVERLEEKAKQVGKSPLELVMAGEDDEFEPLLLGAVAGLAERFGLKGFEDMMKMAPAGLKKEITRFLYTGAKEGGTEWVQGALETLNSSRGSGADWEESLTAMKDFSVSREGAETFLAGSLGANVLGAAGRMAKRSIEKRLEAKEGVSTNEGEIVPPTPTGEANKVLEEVNAKTTVIKEEVGEISPDLEAQLDDIVGEFVGNKKQEEEAKAEVVAETGIPVEEKTPTEEVKAKEAENTKAVEEKAKEIAKNVRDKQSLRSAVTTFLGLNPNSKDDLATATTVSEFIDGIVGSRAKREGITKEEWYKTRVQIGRKDVPEGSKMVDGAMSTILEDGRTLISAFGKSNPLDFLREFGKVIYKDLNESELSAFREVFGIDFQKGVAEDTAMGEFASAFEAYVESGKANTEAFTGRNAPFIKAAFEKMKQWIFDIKENIASLLDGEGSVYVSPQIKSLFDAIVTGTEIQNPNAQTGTETSTVTDVQSDTAVAKDSGVITETTGRETTEIIDLTDTQETIGDEQTTETTDGKRVEQTPPSDKKDRESTKEPDTSTNSKQADKRKATGRKVNLDDLTAKVDKFYSNPVKRTSIGTIGAEAKRGINSIISQIERALKEEDIRASDKKFLEKELKNMNKVLEENNALESEIKALREKNEAKVSQAVDSGVTKAQAESFIRKNPTAEVLSFEDGLIVYTDETGELMSFEPKVGKTYKEKETEKRRADINDRRVREAEEAIERESKEKKSAEQKKSVDRQDKLANQAFSYMTRSDDRKFSAANIRRIIERLSKINLLGEEWKDVKDIAGLPINKFKEEVRNYVESFVSQRLNSGGVPAYLKTFVKEDLLDLKKALEGLDLSEKQRTSINTYVQNLSDEMLGREQSKETAEAKKIERKANAKTSKDVNAPLNVIGISEKSVYAKIAEKILKGFNLWGKDRLTVIDIAYFRDISEEQDFERRGELIDYLKDLVSSYSEISEGDVRANVRSLMNKISEGIKERGPKHIYRPDNIGPSVILIDTITDGKGSKIVAGSFKSHALLHELGHFVTDRLIAKDHNNKKILTDAYDKWVADNKNKGTKVVPSPLLFAKKFLKEDSSEADGDVLRPISKNSIDKQNAYYSSFNEFLAEQFAYWAETKEVPRTALGRLISDIVTAIKKVVGLYNLQFNESLDVQNFLNEHFKFLKDVAKSDLKSAISEVKSKSVKTGVNLITDQRLLADLNKDLSDTKSSKPSFPANATKEEIQEGLRSRKEAISGLEARITKVEKRIESVEKQLAEEHAVFANLGGELSLKDYKDSILKDSEEALMDSLTKTILRDSRNDGDEFLDSGFESFGISPGSDKDAFHASIAKAVTGKFSNNKQFEAIINSINTKLKDAGKTALSKSDIKDIYYRTPFGKISKIKKPLYTSIQKKGTKSKMALFESIDASKADRAKAQQEIADILKNYVANWKYLPKSRTTIYNKIKKEGKMSKDDFTRVAELELVGLANESPAVIDAFIKEGHLRKILRNESSKIEKIANENRSQRNYETGRAFLMDAIGFKENTDGTLTGKMGGKDVKLKVHRMKEAYQNGELVEHLGAVYRVNKDIEAGTKFKQDNFDKVYSFNVHRTKAERDKLEGFLGRVKKFIANASLSSHGIESLIARLSRESTASQMEGEISKLIGEDGFRKASVQSTKDFRTIEEAIDNLGKKLFGLNTVSDVHKKLYDARTKEKTITYKDNDGNTIKKTFYLSELMDLYAAMLQPSLEQRFEGMKNKKGVDASSTMFWNDSKAAAIKDSIPKEYKSFVEGVISDIMPSMYDKINKTFKEINGYDLINIQNYFPLSYDVKEGPGTELDPQMNDIASFITSVSNSNLKNRSVGGAILPGDFVRKMYSYSSRAVHYSNYAVPMKKAVSLFDMSAHYGGYFESVNGKDIMDHIHWNLNNIAANSAAKYNQNKYVDMLRGLSIGGAFMANLTMIPKQLSSFAAYAWKMPSGAWVKYMVTATPQQRIKDVKEIMATDWYKERWRQGGRVNLDTMRLMIDNLSNEINKGGAERKIEYYTAKLNSILFAPTRVGDVGAILLGGGAYWNQLKKDAVVKFPNDTAKQKEWIEIKFAEQSSRTQQSRDMLDASKWSTSSSIASLLTTFMSTPMLYGRVLSGGIKDMQRGYSKGDKKLFAEGAKSVILFSLVLPYLFFGSSNASLGYLSDLWSDDDEDEGLSPIKQTLAMAAIAFTQHIPILYPLLQNTVDKTMLDREFDLGLVPTFSILGKAQDSAIRLSERIQEDGGLDFSDEAVMRDVSNLGKAAGINIASMANLYEAWGNFDESVEENPFLLMGYSRQSLNLDKK